MNLDLTELLRSLNEFRVKYLVIGGYAVSYHSEPRYTKDLDIWVEPSVGNSKKLVSTLSDYGAPVDNLAVDDFAKPGLLYVFGIPPNRVDILTSPKGCRFATAWKNKVTVSVQGVRAKFIGKNDLLKLKRAAGRAQGLIDIEKLRQS